MPRLAALLCAATRRLREAGLAEPRAEARLLLRHASGWSRERLLTEPTTELPAEPAARFEQLVEARAARVPAAYLLGQREFWSRPIAVGPGVLVPRPETETLIEAALEAFPDQSAALRILDLGTGSGCLLVALLDLYPRAWAVGVDRSAEALGWARANLDRHALAGRAALLRGDWAGALAGPFELVVANPPYVATTELAGLEPEVARHEPRAALDGGPDGLAAYRAILPDLARLLAPAGVACLELGRGQDHPLLALAASLGLAASLRADLAGIPRCLVARPRASEGGADAAAG